MTKKPKLKILTAAELDDKFGGGATNLTPDLQMVTDAEMARITMSATELAEMFGGEIQTLRRHRKIRRRGRARASAGQLMLQLNPKRGHPNE